jgi:hypothetical protein
MLGFDVYHTFYVPSWVLAVLALVIVAMPLLAIAATRGRTPRLQRGEASP